MVASSQQWADFFSGKYTFYADGILTGYAEMKFLTTSNPNILQVHIKSEDWNDHGEATFRLKKDSGVDGGVLTGIFKHRTYKDVKFRIGCWELVKAPNGSWISGFDPTGNSVLTRFQGQTEIAITYPDTGPPWVPKKVQLQLNSVQVKKRPDSNYPWNR